MTRQELRRGSDVKVRILDAIIAARVKTDVLTSRNQVKDFLGQYFADVPVEDLEGRDEAVMARIAIDHLEFAKKRRRGRALLRIFNPVEKVHGYRSNYTIIEMVNDDMPFLVDSVTAAINRRELGVHITVHPVIRIKRDGKGNIARIQARDDKDGRDESFVRFAVDRETGPDLL